MMGGVSLEIIGVFCILLVVVAFLYASVGHGGASGYIALMSIFSFPIAFIKPTALLLNICISGIAFWFFRKHKHFKWNLFYPFALTSIPASFLGGYLNVDPTLYKQVLGVVLFIATLRMLGFLGREKETKRKLNISSALLLGCGIGFFSGMIGIGGGIILSPVLVLLGWANLKEAAAVSALFIFVNSASGLLGYASHYPLTTEYLQFIPVALIGGSIGSYYGSKRWNNKKLEYFLAFILTTAGIKLILF